MRTDIKTTNLKSAIRQTRRRCGCSQVTFFQGISAKWLTINTPPRWSCRAKLCWHTVCQPASQLPVQNSLRDRPVIAEKTASQTACIPSGAAPALYCNAMQCASIAVCRAVSSRSRPPRQSQARAPAPAATSGVAIYSSENVYDNNIPHASETFRAKQKGSGGTRENLSDCFILRALETFDAKRFRLTVLNGR